MTGCPCGSGTVYEECCGPVIGGARTAGTAEELMRARYSAYVRSEVDFIFECTHPDYRKGYDHAGTKEWSERSEWLGLEIIGTCKGGEEDDTGEVEFIARFAEKGIVRTHHENAQFRKKGERWYFTEGIMVKPKPLRVTKTGRNDPCSCGSGLKYKKCCGK